MVPVPEDRVKDVMQFVVRIVNQDALEDWDEESIAQMFEDVDEPSRALLSTVAQAVQEGRATARSQTMPLPLIELSPARLIGICSVRSTTIAATERAGPGSPSDWSRRPCPTVGSATCGSCR
ncbi:MAG: hypothetical protein U5K30_01900 [Acidimicrobiales bacterium]|nr:hypothetical protein [Acidimicrobiales bacterium]